MNNTEEDRKHCRLQKTCKTVARDMLLLSPGCVRERWHCLSVTSSIVTLTQNDSVNLAQTLWPDAPLICAQMLLELRKWLEHLAKKLNRKHCLI